MKHHTVRSINSEFRASGSFFLRFETKTTTAPTPCLDLEDQQKTRNLKTAPIMNRKAERHAHAGGNLSKFEKPSPSQFSRRISELRYR